MIEALIKHFWYGRKVPEKYPSFNKVNVLETFLPEKLFRDSFRDKVIALKRLSLYYSFKAFVLFWMKFQLIAIL